MSAIGALITEDEDAVEQLPAFVDALTFPSSTRVRVVTDHDEVETEDPSSLDEESLQGRWALVHVQGPQPARVRQPVCDPDGRLACCIEDPLPRTGDRDVLEPDELADRVRDAMEHPAELAPALQQMAPSLDVTSPVVFGNERGLVALRDRTGTSPLYHGRTPEMAALASTRNALWRVGLEAKRLNPDTLVLLHPERSQTIHLPRREGDGARDAAHDRVLASAVEARVEGLDSVGLAATHPAAAALTARALSDVGSARVHAFVPVMGDGGRANAIEKALQDAVDEVQRIPIEPEVLQGRVGELLHALEARHQALAADGLVPLLVASHAARENGPVLIADRGPAEPYLPSSLLVAASHDGADPGEEGHIVGEGPLERAHKIARAVGVTLRAPRGDPRVDAVERGHGGSASDLDAFLMEQADDRGLGAQAPHALEAERRGVIEVLREAVADVDHGPVPDVYNPAESLDQTAEGGPQRGRAVLDTDGPEGLDRGLQWGLDHAALDAGALGPGEQQRLARYLEDVQAHQAQTNP